MIFLEIFTAYIVSLKLNSNFYGENKVAKFLSKTKGESQWRLKVRTEEGIGFLSQMGNSFKSILTGVILLPVSFVIIYNVETCEQASAALKNAVPVGQAKDNQPSYVTGILKANPLGGRFVKSGPYISYSVSSEVYAWDEEVKTEGSGSNKKEVRNCVLKWTSSPENPSNFKLSGCRTKPYRR